MQNRFRARAPDLEKDVVAANEEPASLEEVAEGGFTANEQALSDLSDRLSLPSEESKRKRCPDVSGLTVALTKRYPHKVRIKPMLPVSRFIESRTVQGVITLLFVLDVIIVLTELIIETEILRQERTICEIELAALQNETHDCGTTAAGAAKREGAATSEPAGGNNTGHDPGEATSDAVATLHALETAEEVLHWVSIGILVSCFFGVTGL